MNLLYDQSYMLSVCRMSGGSQTSVDARDVRLYNDHGSATRLGREAVGITSEDCNASPEFVMTRASSTAPLPRTVFLHSQSLTLRHRQDSSEVDMAGLIIAAGSRPILLPQGSQEGGGPGGRHGSGAGRTSVSSAVHGEDPAHPRHASATSNRSESSLLVPILLYSQA